MIRPLFTLLLSLCLIPSAPAAIIQGDASNAGGASAYPSHSQEDIATWVGVTAKANQPIQVSDYRISRVNGIKGAVALSYDDGPHPIHTPRILDLLKKYNAKATFFVLGSCVARNPHLLSRMVAEGHEVAIHTWTHCNLARVSWARAQREFTRSSEIIEKYTGIKPRAMRPPYGAGNNKTFKKIFEKYGTPAILWDVDPQDWRRPGSTIVAQRVLRSARDGSIILLHDIHAPSTLASEYILSNLQARGIRVLTVSALIDEGKTGIRNLHAGYLAPTHAADDVLAEEIDEASLPPELRQLPTMQPFIIQGAAIPVEPILQKESPEASTQELTY